MHVCLKVACLSVPSVVAVVVTRRGSELSLSHSNCSLARPPSPCSAATGGNWQVAMQIWEKCFQFCTDRSCGCMLWSWRWLAHPVLSPHPEQQLWSPHVGDVRGEFL